MHKKEWEFVALTFTWESSFEKIDYLHLTIGIDQKTRKIYTKTFQNPMNLCLFIPEQSAHPEGYTKGFMFGFVYTYYHQNTSINDFKQVASSLLQRLIDRGCKRDQSNEIFIGAAHKLDKQDS